MNMRRWFSALTLGVMLGVTVGACAKPDRTEKIPEAYHPPQVGDISPVFTVPTLGGDSVRIGGATTQQATLVNVWATWCGPCKAEFPELQTLHTTFGPRGLRVLAISIDTDDDAAVAASAKAMGATFVIGRDPADQVRGQFAAVGIPESFLVSRDGHLLWRHSGAIPPGDMAVRAAISDALGSAAATP